MALSAALRTSIINTIENNALNLGTPSFYRIDANDLIKFFMEIKPDKDKLEVPVCAFPSYKSSLRLNLSADEISTVIVPFTVDNYYGTFRTANAIFKKFFDGWIHCRLMEVSFKAFETYYGHKGMILDKDFNVLMCLYYSFHREEVTWKSDGVILKVNSKVFSNTDDISKNIVSGFIPLISTHSFRIPETVYSYQDRTVKGKVIIDDCKDLIVKPSLPRLNLIEDNYVNNLLYNNFESYFRFLR